MPFEFGDVVLLPFPFTNNVAVKKGPAVVVSSAAYNRIKPDVIVMAITSQLRESRSIGEVWIGAWADAGLLKPSVIKPFFATIEMRLVIRTLGQLGANEVSALRRSIAEILA